MTGTRESPSMAQPPALSFTTAVHSGLFQLPHSQLVCSFSFPFLSIIISQWLLVLAHFRVQPIWPTSITASFLKSNLVLKAEEWKLIDKIHIVHP